MTLSDERIQELLTRGEYDAICECRCAFWKLKSLAVELAQEVIDLRKENKDIGRWRSFLREPPEVAEGQELRVLGAFLTKHRKSYCSPYVAEVAMRRYADTPEIVCETQSGGSFLYAPEYWRPMPNLPTMTEETYWGDEDNVRNERKNNQKDKNLRRVL